jgi:CHAT domain-containing protein
MEPREEPDPEGRKQVVAFAPFAGPGTGGVPPGATPQRGSSPPSSAPVVSRWSFDPLPASQREVAGIAGLYPGKALSFSGDEANEDTVKNNPAVSKAHRLHFATHASIDERFPENSALVFAARGSQDELLQVHEIFNLKLSADLAVLSACQTALGKEVTGEGLVGLTRAFFYAGVPSLVVSLWNVVDGATPDFMIDFYKNLDQLNGKASALQKAKTSMIEHKSYAHPSYWAPFILIGASR